MISNQIFKLNKNNIDTIKILIKLFHEFMYDSIFDRFGVFSATRKSNNTVTH